MELLDIHSCKREEMLDITAKLAATVTQNKWLNGALFLFCQHTTCGITINEGADPAVQADLIRFFQEIAPNLHNWSHFEGNTDAHIRASLLGSSLLIPVQNGKLQLGRWQSVYLYEGDGPRKRTLSCQFLVESK